MMITTTAALTTIKITIIILIAVITPHVIPKPSVSPSRTLGKFSELVGGDSPRAVGVAPQLVASEPSN